MTSSNATRVIRRDGRASSIEFLRCELVVIAGADKGKHLSVEGTRISIGTSPECQLVLSDASVSRTHCEFEIEERGFRIRDLDSTNGVTSGGIQIRDAFLEPGATFKLGDTEIELRTGAERAEIRLSAADHFGDVIGKSIAMREIFFILEKMAPRDVTVLLSGETGTGKEVFARAIHDASPRAEKPFVTVDCGSLPENLIEAELFGHSRGAFTGAVGERAGAFEDADGGTVFLDEIGELPLSQQAKLLRVLESREVKRLGENAMRTVNVRVICATNRSLAECVEAETFRKDLFFRISVLAIRIPPLRDRRDDIASIAAHLVRSLTPAGKTAPELSPGAIRALEAHPWPGNVRELRNVMEKAIALAEGGTIDPGLIALGTVTPDRHAPAGEVDGRETYSVAHDRFERAYLAALLKRHDMNVTKAAQSAGIHRQTIHRLLRKHGVNLDDLR